VLNQASFLKKAVVGEFNISKKEHNVALPINLGGNFDTVSLSLVKIVGADGPFLHQVFVFSFFDFMPLGERAASIVFTICSLVPSDLSKIFGRHGLGSTCII
jgi:hypothetical protein